MNILICDDIHSEALQLEEIIKNAGFEAVCTHNEIKNLSYHEDTAGIKVSTRNLVKFL